MNKFNTLHLVSLAVIASFFYDFSFRIGRLPLSLFQIFLYIALILALSDRTSRLLICSTAKVAWRRSPGIVVGAALMIIGTTSSAIASDGFTLSELGIIREWFLEPLLLSILIATFVKTRADTQLISLSCIFSVSAIAAASYWYLLSDVVTFDGRLSAFYPSPNYLAITLAPILSGIVVYILLEKKATATSSRLVLPAIGMFFLTIPIIFTHSYGAWLSVVGACVIGTYRKTLTRIRVIISFAVLTMFLLMIAFAVSGDKASALITANPRSSLASRKVIWSVSLAMIRDHPVFGIGPGNFQEKYLEYQKYFPPYLEWAVPQPHNLVLAFWLQSGVFGLVGFGVLLWSWFAMLWHQRERNALLNSDIRALRVIIAAMATILFIGILDTPYWKDDWTVQFWVIMSIGLCYALLPKETSVAPSRIT